MSEYADITLLECNRRQSDSNETLTNNSMWTNRMGSVIELEMGDQISIESAFINQKGCANPVAIEFRGVDLNAKGTFNYSQDIKPEIKTETGEGNLVQQTNTIFSNKLNIDHEIELKDNEMNIEVSFYKTANGENHIFLPRNHLPEQSPTNTDAFSYSNASIANIWKDPDFTLDDQAGTDAQTKGMDRGAITGIGHYAPDSLGLAADYSTYWTGHLRKGFNWNDYGLYYSGTLGHAEGLAYDKSIDGFATDKGRDKGYYTIRPKINNDRYTMFQKNYMFENYDNINKVKYKADDPVTNPADIYITSIDYFNNQGTALIAKQIDRYLVDTGQPASHFEYHEVKDLLTLKLEKGFQSPQSIAEQLTQQLQTETEDSPETFNVLNDLAGTAKMSYTIKTKTFKTYNAANYGDFNKTNWDKYMTTKDIEAFNYYSTFNTIYVKRADLFTAGRAINNWIGNVGIAGGEVDPFIKTLGDFGTPNYIQNTIELEKVDTLGVAEEDRIGNYKDPIDTSWEWNDYNLSRLNELFKVQGNYPELFKCMNTDRLNENELFRNKDWSGYNYAPVPPSTTPTGLNVKAPTLPTIDNSRFLHMNRFSDSPAAFGVKRDFGTLGSDNMKKHTYTQTIDPAITDASFNIPHSSLPIFFRYIPSLADKYIENPDKDNDLLCYGFASKCVYGGKTFIRIHTEAQTGQSQGINLDFFRLRGGYKVVVGITETFHGYKIEGGTTRIGWDYHFNSYGNVCMLGFQGDLGEARSGEYQTGYGSDFNNMNPVGAVPEKTDPYGFLGNKVRSAVMGANNPAMIYDGVSGKFGFKDLHMPEKIGQAFNAGQTAAVAIENKVSTATTIPLIADASQVCYKINKRIRNGYYCPDLEGNTTIIEGNTQAINHKSENLMSFTFMNERVSPNVIFDSHMGINLNLGNCFKISDFNRQPEIWNRGMLGLMGFTYNQFNPTLINENNRGDARVDFRNINSLHKPTTNCEVLNTDIQNYTMNPYGGIIFSPTITNPVFIPIFNFASDASGHRPAATFKTYFPPIVQDTNSITIEGLQLPSLVARPYLTIRSDILSHSKYIGGKDSGLSLPIISVINKINADKDFIQVADSSFNYTITRPTKFSQITTAITNPDGTLASTDDGNAVIYKIMKKGDLTNFDIISQILNETKKGKKK